MNRKLIASIISILLMSGCQAPPTKSYDSQPIQPRVVSTTIPVITEQTVVIDARSPFEFSLWHLNGSINLQWQDFNQKTKPFLGLLELDTFSLARRFATYGIGPNTPVVVVGKGPHGNGEEGRLAWTLKVLGVSNVRFSSIELFSQPKTKEEAPPRKSETLWKPVVDDTLSVDKDLFQHRRTAVVIDVRSEAEYLGKDAASPYAKSAPEVGAFNIPWVQFFDEKGLVSHQILSRLQAVGITPDREIYVVDNVGVRSAAVTLALRELGFAKAANFAGGYMELVH